MCSRGATAAPTAQPRGRRATARATIGLGLLSLSVLAACSSGKHASAAATGPLTLSSPAFAAGQLIPITYTCAETNVSPPLTWTAPPAGTAQQAVVLVDLDVAPQYVHWVLTGLKPSVHALAAGEVPAGAVASDGSNGAATYFGPCPPQGSVHRYRVTVYALKKKVAVTAATTAADALTAITGNAIAQSSITARFGR